MTEKEIKNYLYDSTKYYPTPIEDIRIGYECEILEGFNWNKYINPNPKKGIQEDTIIYQKILNYAAERDDAKLIRTLHLTKEQIEAEGWEIVFYKDSDNPHFIKKDFECFLHENNIITIVNKGYNFLYKGECKSINEFRYICKLLKI